MNDKGDFHVICEIINKYFDSFSIWISKLSVGKFFFFLLFVLIGSGQVQKIIFSRSSDNWIDTLTILFVLMCIAIKFLITSKVKADNKAHDALEIAEKQTLLRQLSEAKIQVLQSQIEPHFLFNTLSSLQFLIESDPKKANQMLLNLSTYLRYALPQIREYKAMSTIGREMENIQAYLKIMEIRMGENLKLVFNVDEQLNNAFFPSMMLQPVVENAIKHGIELSMDGGLIEIKIHKENEQLVVCVHNTGYNRQNYSKTSGNGIALQNIEERLNHIYQGKSSLDINSEENSFTVTFKVPFLLS